MGILPVSGKSAFHSLLNHCARQHDWTLVPEWSKHSPTPPGISNRPSRSTGRISSVPPIRVRDSPPLSIGWREGRGEGPSFPVAVVLFRCAPLDTSLNNFIDWLPVIPYAWASMSLYQHPLFTIDLNKVIAVYQNEDEAAVTIRTDDQRKIEVATASQEEAAEFLNEFADQWEKAVGPLLRHDKYVFLTAAMYSIQAEG